MDLNKIIALMSEPEKLNSPNEIVLVNQYVSEFISDFEQQIYDQDIIVSEEWTKLRKELSSDTAANKKQKGMPEHRKLHELEMIYKRLKRFRSDNQKKIELIMQKGYR